MANQEYSEDDYNFSDLVADMREFSYEETQAAIKKERSRIMRLLKGMPDKKKKMLDKVIDNAAFTAVKLAQARELLMCSSIIVPYDNGGGQRGVRKSPGFDAYNALSRTYCTYVDRLVKNMPEGEEKDELTAWSKEMNEIG